ncbi:MAG: dual specificity protein phosphatase family protein [Paracoccaceae bacterium]|jgi:protein-tyrosine phosphatase|nr:dual specificity protein phosphatase family protein [Paracoccaceae bacterium]MDG1939585.1 dual specificity protein phosphatase family protein [Paracoccaceae bacterium]|tara:strand:+ start:3176 stop:3751 length:576 start_codon:yes stop_codon:yes gene_type:complete
MITRAAYLQKLLNIKNGSEGFMKDNFPISWIPVPGKDNQSFGVSNCPGKHQNSLLKKLSLKNDLNSIWNQEINCIVSLITKDELKKLDINDFDKTITEYGFEHYSVEIQDLGIPSTNQLGTFKILTKNIIVAIKTEKKVLIHCNAGLGRSGLFAGILVKEMTDINHPIDYIRKFRKGAIETKEQEEFISFW